MRSAGSQKTTQRHHDGNTLIALGGVSILNLVRPWSEDLFVKCVKRLLHLFVWSAATWRALYSTLDGARGQVADFSRLGAHIYSVYLLLEAKHFSRFDPKSLTFAATVEVLGPP